jgi:hypothetical protein
MRYLVKARLKPGRQSDLLKAIETGDLGRGSIAGDEYQHNMEQAPKTASRTGLRPAFALCRWRRNVLIGKSSSISYRSKMRTRGRIAATKMELSRGRAAIAIAPPNSRTNCARPENPF